MMNTGLLETCREVKYIKKCVKLVMNANYSVSLFKPIKL